MSADGHLRELLSRALAWGDAHASFDDAVADLDPAFRGVRPQGLSHSAWELLEHLRIAQWDILEFTRDPRHVSPRFADGYWPAGDAPPDAAAWERSLAGFRDDLKGLCDLVANPATDLFARIPHGEGQTVLREALLVADHNAYHLGQMVMLRKLLGVWD